MKKSELFFGLLKIPLDFFMAIFAFILAYKVRSLGDFIPYYEYQANITTFPDEQKYLQLITLGTIGLIIIYTLRGMYSFRVTQKLSKELREIFYATTIWLMLVIAYYFMIRDFPFSRLVLGFGWFFCMVLVGFGRSIVRLIQRSILKYGIGQRKMLFIGNNYLSQKIAEVLGKNPLYEIAGVLTDDRKQFHGLAILGDITNLEKIVKHYKIEEIIQTKSGLCDVKSVDILNFCRQKHLQYHFVPDIIEVHRTNIEISEIHGIPLISLKPTPLDGWGKINKRVFDFVCAVLGLIILSPIFLIISVLIKLDSKGPVFFRYLDDGSRAKRVGQYGKLFDCLKFRTMKPKTHNLRYTVLADRNIRKGGPLVKIAKDPRITRVGGILRKTSFDELPQLWNVLKGEMSLVGPRPHLPEEVAKYKKEHLFVLTIKPGITGMAQISGRSDLDFEEEIRLDTYYIQHWSILLDLKIILKTLAVVLKKYEE